MGQIKKKKFKPNFVSSEGKDGFLSSKIKTYESESDVLARINHWVEENSIKVINIETVLVPKGHSFTAKTCMDIASQIAGYSFGWQHVIHVWYHEA